MGFADMTMLKRWITNNSTILCGNQNYAVPIAFLARGEDGNLEGSKIARYITELHNNNLERIEMELAPEVVDLEIAAEMTTTNLDMSKEEEQANVDADKDKEISKTFQDIVDLDRYFSYMDAITILLVDYGGPEENSEAIEELQNAIYQLRQRTNL